LPTPFQVAIVGTEAWEWACNPLEKVIETQKHLELCCTGRSCTSSVAVIEPWGDVGTNARGELSGRPRMAYVLQQVADATPCCIRLAAARQPERLASVLGASIATIVQGATLQRSESFDGSKASLDELLALTTSCCCSARSAADRRSSSASATSRWSVAHTAVSARYARCGGAPSRLTPVAGKTCTPQRPASASHL
jgi:hypothetical protein